MTPDEVLSECIALLRCRPSVIGVYQLPTSGDWLVGFQYGKRSGEFLFTSEELKFVALKPVNTDLFRVDVRLIGLDGS